jgi:hypothetical protein
LRPYWVESGNKSSYARFLKKLIPSPGYDRVAQERIYHILNTDTRFRAQITELLANKGTEIEIEEEMSYHPFVTFLTSFSMGILNRHFVNSVADLSPTQLWTLLYYAGYLTKMVNSWPCGFVFIPTLT